MHPQQSKINTFILIYSYLFSILIALFFLFKFPHHSHLTVTHPQIQIKKKLNEADSFLQRDGDLRIEREPATKNICSLLQYRWPVTEPTSLHSWERKCLYIPSLLKRASVQKESVSSLRTSHLSLSLPWNPIVGDAFTLSGDDELIADEMSLRRFLLSPRSVSSFLSLLLRSPVAGKFIRC